MQFCRASRDGFKAENFMSYLTIKPGPTITISKLKDRSNLVGTRL